jgi:hypothetical protein
VSGAVLGLCCLATAALGRRGTGAGHAASRDEVRAQARRLGVAVHLLTVSALAFVEMASAAWSTYSDAAFGALDLSRSWEWPHLLLASLGPATIAYWTTLRRHARTAPELDLVGAHESALQAMVAAKMAIELEDAARAEQMLGLAISSSSSIIDAVGRR